MLIYVNDNKDDESDTEVQAGGTLHTTEYPLITGVSWTVTAYAHPMIKIMHAGY